MTKFFKIVGRLEGISFLTLLFIAMPLKYYANDPLLVRLLGPAHGILFLLYCVLAFSHATERSWPIKQHLLAYAAAVLPFGTFMFERKYLDNAKILS